jgi:predicted HTH domain antitoxin
MVGNRLMPPYDEETAQKITELAQKTLKAFREIMEKNNIKISLGNEDINC